MQDVSKQSDSGQILRAIGFAALGLILAASIFAAGFATGSGLSAIDIVNSVKNSTDMPIMPLAAPASAQEQEDVDMDVFWEVWNTLEDRFYYDLPDEQTRVQGAINGLIESLGDPHTAYVPPEIAKILAEDNMGEFEGIGAYVETGPDGGVYIIRVFEDSPAEAAGLHEGDVIIAVDGTDVTDVALNEALLLIRGEAGTTVDLTVVREGADDIMDVTVTRARLEIPTVETEMLTDDIGYVALFEFNARASQALEGALKELMDDGAKAIVFDLRNDPGGFLDESIQVADLFLKDGTVVIQRNVDGETREYTSREGDLAEDIPLVVLVNENSASASEIVAAAIQENGRGTLIGETTFGKGSVQLQYNLSDGGMLRVTYANWFTPDDHLITDNGVTPDIVVETPDDEVVPPGGDADTDPQLERAIEFLETGE
jgi:carboxyl-terminal processing protease